MPKIIPPETESKVILCRLEGKSRKATYLETGVSETKIQQIWNDFKDKVGQAKFDALSQFGEILVSKGMTFVEWSDEFCIRSRLDRLGVKIDSNLDSFADDLYLACKESKVNPTTIVKEISDLRNLSSQTDIPIGKLSDQLKQTKSELDKLQQLKHEQLQEIAQLKKDTATAKKEKADALAQKNVTNQELNEYTQDKEDLKKLGISVKDPSRLKRVLSQVKDCGWNSSQINQDLSLKLTLKEQITQQQTKIETNNTTISKQNQIINQQAKQIASNNTTITNQKSRIKELAKQDTQLVQALDIRENLYKFEIQKFDSNAKVSIKNVQEKGTDAIVQTAKKVIEDQEKFCKDQKDSFSQITETLAKAVTDIALTVQSVASLKAIQPLYRLLFLRASTPEAVRAIMLPLNCFITLFEIDPKFNPATLSRAKDFQRSLQGDLKRLK